MLQFPVAVEKLESTEQFRSFKEKNRHAFLLSGFFMSNTPSLDHVFWQLDYLDTKTEKITSFLMKEHVEVRHEQEMVKSGEQLQELKYEDIKVNYLDALGMAKNEINDQKPAKIIVIIQNISNIPTWNITFILETFNVFNIRINASSGEVLKKKQESILSFRNK